MGLPNYAANVSYSGISGMAFEIAKVEARKSASDPTPEDTSGPVIRAKPFTSLSEAWNRTTSMDPAISAARTWLTICLAEHNDCARNPRFCRIYGGGSSHQVIDLDHETAMPSRLLQILDTQVRLVEVNKTYIEYVALSHCWGKLHTLTTTTENREQLMAGVQLSDLPTTYADAVDFTKGLGYRHIWIDSLCIVQDDIEDWKEQAPRMACIYGNAICTLSALDAPDDSAGLFVADGLSQGVLDTRGWVLQERMISPRNILFSGRQVSYECRQCDATSKSSDLTTRTRHDAVSTEHPKDVFVFFRDFELPSVSITYKGNQSMVLLSTVQELMGRDDLLLFKQVWWKFIERFSTLQLTKTVDKFLAISGITNTVLRNIQIQNFYGLWGGPDLMDELLWYVDLDGPEGDHGWDFLGPTWSWASLHSGRIKNDLWNLNEKTRGRLMLKPWMELPHSTSFEHELPYKPWCTLGALCIGLKGNLRKATITKHVNASSQKNQYKVDIESAGRISDHETFEFRPDAANEFSDDHPVEVTCLYLTNYRKGTVDDKYHVDIYLILNKMHVYENEQGNLHPDGEYVRFWFETPRYGPGVQGQMRFVTNTFNPEDVEDERVGNQRTFMRVGYMLVRYEERRDEEGIYEDFFWRYLRIV